MPGILYTEYIYGKMKGSFMEPRRNHTIFFVILLLITVWGYAALALEPPLLPNGWNSHHNPEAGFAFGYPGDWILEESHTSAPAEGFRVWGNGLDIYTNFLGGFEQYGEMGRRTVALAGGEKVIMTVNREVAMLPGDVIEDPNRRLILVSIPDIGPSGLLVYSYDVNTDSGAPEIIEALLSTFTILDSSTAIGDIPTDWRTYSGGDSSLSFRYPSDWEIKEELIYETAGGAAADVPSITLGKIGNANSNEWIRINPRQFQTEYGACLEAGAHTICTYSSDPAVIGIMELIVSSFSAAD